MKQTLIAISLAAGLSAAFAAAPAMAQSPADGVVLSAKKKVHPVRYRHMQPSYVACTKTGCRPTPPGCYPAVGREWDDTPSAFDVIVCPPRRYPG